MSEEFQSFPPSELHDVNEMTRQVQESRESEAPRDPRLRNAPSPVELGVNDAREDSAAVLGAFVDIVSGSYAGRYGVFTQLMPDGVTAVVRTRDADSVSVSTAITDLRPAKAGRR